MMTYMGMGIFGGFGMLLGVTMGILIFVVLVLVIIWLIKQIKK